MTLALLLLIAAFDVTSGVKQGEVIRVRTNESGQYTASLGDRKAVRLFPDPESGGQLGLIPVPVDYPPGDAIVKIVDKSTGAAVTEQLKILDAHFPIQNIRATPAMQALKPLPGEMEEVHALQETVSERRYWAQPFELPVAGCILSPFGVQRYHNGKPSGNYHRGLDQRAAQGRAIRAPASGIVRIAKMYRLHGGTVGIDHGQGVVSLHLHLSELKVKPGARVERGQVIGLAGATGFATGPHLHWGLYVNGLPVNPLPWLPVLRDCN